MTSVWRRRPGSRAGAPAWRAAAAGLPAPLVLSLLLLLLLGAMGRGAPPAHAQGVAARPFAPGAPQVISLTDPGTTRADRDRFASWRADDVRWLRGLPAGRAGLTLAAAGAEPTRLRELVARALPADGDTVPVARPVEHLLRDRWQARGHLTAAVRLRADTLLVTPGPAWTIGAWDLTGDDFPGRDHLLRTWLPQPGDPFAAVEIDRAIDRVLAGTGEGGYPYARWVTRGVEPDPATTSVTIEALLLPGTAAIIGPITSDLPETRAQRFLARASGLQRGDPFRHSELARAVDRLYARDLYASVGTPGVYPTTSPDTVGIHFPVVARRKVNRLQVVLGLSRREEGGSRLSGEVDLRLPNMGGSGRKLQVGWRDDGQDRSRFGFSYLEPLAFGTGLDMGLAVDNEVQRGVYTRFSFDNSWNLPVVALWGVELGLGLDRTTYPEGALERSNRRRASGAVEHRRGDRSRSGWEGMFAIETAWRSATARGDTTGGVAAGAQLGEASTQRIFRIDVGGELWLGSTLSVFGRTSFRQLTGGQQDVPLSEQFRFGGANSLRGYREGEFHGRQAAWGSMEARIGRPQGSRLYTFYDLGYFEFWTTDPAAAAPDALLRRRGWPRGYGLGILARTPGGDISLAVGFPGTVDFDQAKLHVTLLETF